MQIYLHLNTLRSRQNGRRFPDDIFQCIFLYENVLIWTKVSVQFIPKGPINNIPDLFQIMGWCRSGDKPLSEPMMSSFLTHICVTGPQWVNSTRVTTNPAHINPHQKLTHQIIRSMTDYIYIYVYIYMPLKTTIYYCNMPNTCFQQ